jgi:DeoR/GlpR family transcriptional regulator of sugar metabolism
MKKRLLMPVERKERILSMIYEKSSVTVTELSLAFGVSEETIRRDLTELEKENGITRVYGGAYLGNNVNQELSYDMRCDAYRSEKSTIASAAIHMVHNGDTVFLGPSTTSLAIAQSLCNLKNITIITNALYIANAVADSQAARIICVGGELDKNYQTFNGCTALETLETYYADKAFVSCTGVSMECGLTDSSENQARIRRLMLEHSKERILIADHTKFGKITLSSIAPFSMINRVICNRSLSDEWLRFFEEHHISFVNASDRNKG